MTGNAKPVASTGIKLEFHGSSFPRSVLVISLRVVSTEISKTIDCVIMTVTSYCLSGIQPRSNELTPIKSIEQSFRLGYSTS